MKEKKELEKNKRRKNSVVVVFTLKKEKLVLESMEMFSEKKFVNNKQKKII